MGGAFSNKLARGKVPCFSRQSEKANPSGESTGRGLDPERELFTLKDCAVEGGDPNIAENQPQRERWG